MTELDELKLRLASELSRQPAPTRAELTRRRNAAVVVGVAAVVGGYFALGQLHGDRPGGFLWSVAAGWLLVALAITITLVRPRHQMVHPMLRRWWIPAVAAPLALMGLSLLGNVLYPITFQNPWGQCPARPGLVCLDLNLTLGALPLLLLALVLRRKDVVHPVASGAWLGGALGTWTSLVLHLCCECTSPAHVALGHVAPMLLLTCFGAFISWRLSEVPPVPQPR